MPYKTDIPGQISEFQLKAIELVASIIPPNSHILEVGSLFGRSSYAWAKSCDPTVTVHCIDPWEGNKGIRAMENRLGIKYGIDTFLNFTSDCDNIAPHKGYSPKDFQHWETPLDLYYEDAVHHDPILSQNINFWSQHLKPSGILCGDDFRPRFADVRAAAQRMSRLLNRRLQIVDHFWCLLPNENELPGASVIANKLDELAHQSIEAKQSTGIRFSLKPESTPTTLQRTAETPFRVTITNEGSSLWDSGEEHPQEFLFSVHEVSDPANTKELAQVQIPLSELQPDIPYLASLHLNLTSLPNRPAKLKFTLFSPEKNELTDFSMSNVELINIKENIGDFAEQKQDSALGVQSLRADDVVHAYRWILGREPESTEKITTHSQKAKGNPKLLRMMLIKSAEFGKQIQAAGVASTQKKWDATPLSTFTPNPIVKTPTVFIHLPKTGGTTVHHHWESKFSPEQTCEWRHNDILSSPAGSLVGKDFFSGHFDARVLHLVPNAQLITVIRDPRERLYSLYRHLRFTTPLRALSENHDLADLARMTSFRGFLEQAAERNPGTVDNVYVRAFGGTLPQARWEATAEQSWKDAHASPSQEQWKEMLERAKQVLSLPDTTILPFATLDESLRKYLEDKGTPLEESILHLKNSQNISDQTNGFKPMQIEEYSSKSVPGRLVMHDEELIQLISDNYFPL